MFRLVLDLGAVVSDVAQLELGPAACLAYDHCYVEAVWLKPGSSSDDCVALSY